MDMTLLSKMIAELLTEHNIITLPGLGCVRSETVGASFSDKGYTINPPYRKIGFCAREGSDTLLCDLYARDNNLSEKDSKAMIKAFLSQIKTMLGEKKTVLFPGLGQLREAKDDNYIFIQDEGSEVCPEFFGLAPLSLKNHQFSCDTVPEMKEIPQEETHLSPSTKDNKGRLKSLLKSRTFRRVLLWTLFAVLFLMALLRILGTVAPEFIDRFLYSTDELRIIYY